MVADQQSNSRWRTIGILDVDLCGPIIPRMMNVEGKDNYSCSFLLVGFQCTQARTCCHVNGFLVK
ncbi:cytosolic Fe-S cluster assembly factor Nubp2 homolog [Oculina patagonica]